MKMILLSVEGDGKITGIDYDSYEPPNCPAMPVVVYRPSSGDSLRIKSVTIQGEDKPAIIIEVEP